MNALHSRGLKAVVLSYVVAGLSPALAADYVIIVNKDNANAADKDFIAKVYKGEVKSWKDGGAVVFYDLPEDSPVRAAFDTDVIGKTPSQLRAMWASLTFSGKALPPKAAANDAEIISAVASNKNAIGYVSMAPANAAVKTVK
jgi:ABC-type phosphate transport system substrate-binding protein